MSGVPGGSMFGDGTLSALAPFVVALLVAAATLVAPGGRSADGADGGGRRLRARLHGAGTRLAGRVRPSRPVGRGRREVDLPADAVASAMVLIALGYRSGLPTWQVLAAVAARAPEPVARDLAQVAAALQWGLPDRQAWASVGQSWAPVTRAVHVAAHAGVPPGPLLLQAAEELRQADLERLEVAAATVGVRLVAPLGLVLLPAFCLTTVVPLVLALGRQVLTSG
ncbi:MAG: type II secretion system F family protein [Terracoccus sp.]